MHNEPKQGAAEVTATPTPKPCWCGPEGCADSRCAGRAKGAITEPKIPPVMLTPEAWAAEAVLRATRQDDLLLAQAMNVEARRYIALGEELERLREIIGAVQHSDREDIDAALQIAAEGQIQGDTTAYALAAGTLAAEVRRQREMLSPKPCCGDFVSCPEACAVRADHWKDFRTGVSEGTGQIMTPIDATADGQLSAPIMGEPLPVTNDAEMLVRFCPECGHVGPVASGYTNCCPDGINAREIPGKLAEQCRELFMRAVHPQTEDAAVARVKIHPTGGNAGIAWSAVPLEHAPMMRGGELLYLHEPTSSQWRTTAKPIAWRVAGCTPPAMFTPGEPSWVSVQYWSGIGMALEYAYAAAPAPRPLTAEQKRAMWMGTTSRGNGGQADWYRLGIEDAERAHGITEAPAAGSTS